MLVDPVTFLDIVDGIAENNTVTDDLAACRNIAQGNLVSLRDVLIGHKAFHNFGSSLQILNGYNDVILVFDLDIQTSHTFPPSSFHAGTRYRISVFVLCIRDIQRFNSLLIIPL